MMYYKNSRRPAFEWIALICRTLLGLTFLLSGAIKAIDPLGTAYKIEEYLQAFGEPFSQLSFLGLGVAFVLITFEFMVGVMLLLNIKTKLAALLSLLLMLGMTPLTLYIALNNPVSDCGCFGDAIVLDNWTSFYKNCLLLAVNIALVIFTKHLHRTFTNLAEALSIVLFTGGVVGFMLFTLNRLPIIDFRPYAIGTDIVAGMEIPADAERDLFEIAFVYQKDGVEQTFSLENYPKEDSTWVFVRQQTTLVKKGYIPPIHDFSIINSNYEEITFDILENREETYLVVMYDLNKANKTGVQKLHDLIRRAQQKNIELYILTGSDAETIHNFKQQNRLEASFCTTDPTTLKTIIRANPGLVVVKNGVIIEKLNLRQLQ